MKAKGRRTAQSLSTSGEERRMKLLQSKRKEKEKKNIIYVALLIISKGRICLFFAVWRKSRNTHS